MAEPQTVELRPYAHQNSINRVGEQGRVVYNERVQVQHPVTGKIIYSIIMVCLSSFFFGFCLTCSEFFIGNFNEKFMLPNNGSSMNNTMENMNGSSMNNTMENMNGSSMNNTMENMNGNSMNNLMENMNVSSMNNLMENMNGRSMNNMMENMTSLVNETNMHSPSALTPNAISWFLSINLLGALVGNIVISNFHLNRKLIVMLNNFGYLVAVVMMYFPSHVAPLILGKFILGISSGITCAYVPAYLTELKIYRWSGLIGSFQSVLVTLGIVFGFLQEMCFHNHRVLGFIVICSFLLVHSLALVFVLKTRSEKRCVDIKTLFANKESWKSVIMCSIFHLTQQASGVNVVVICASILLNNTKASENGPVFVGISQFLATLIAMIFVDRFGRKPLMIISIIGVCVSLSIISFTHLVEIGMYIFMIFFSFGLGPITWFITGELVPLEYRDATNQIATSMNWLSAFIAVVTQEYLFKTLGTYMFTIYLSFMIVYLIYLIVFFKETRGRAPSFL